MPPKYESGAMKRKRNRNEDIYSYIIISNANAQRLSGREKEGCRILYKAALSGDWKAAEPVLRSDKSVACLSMTKVGDTPLHLAALAKQTVIVRMLIKYTDEGDLEIKNIYGNTAFFCAAVSGDVEIAKLMYEKNNTLPTIRNKFDKSPIQEAAALGNKKMVEYLYEITPLQDFEAKECMNILAATIDTGIYDIALKILKADGSIVASSPDVIIRGCALHKLAQKPFSYYGTSREWICENLVRIAPYVPCSGDTAPSVMQSVMQAIQPTLHTLHRKCYLKTERRQ